MIDMWFDLHSYPKDLGDNIGVFKGTNRFE